MRIYFLISVFYLLPVVFPEKMILNFNPENVIRDDDLKDCYHRTNPTLNGKVTEVYVNVAILDIDEINEDAMEFRLHAYIFATWRNDNFELVVENQSIPTLLPPNLVNCIWQPDIIFPNAKKIDSFKDTVLNKGFKKLPNGELYRVERLIMKVSCAMVYMLYPMDTQNCHLIIALKTLNLKYVGKLFILKVNNPDDLVLLHWSVVTDGLTYSYPIEPLKFYIMNPRKHRQTENWVTGNYTELWANITFHRRLTGSVINFYVPSTMTVFLSWLSFYIDVDAAPARVSLGVTSLLTITTQIAQARNVMPPVQYITSLDVWLFACLIVVFASFIEYSVAYSYRVTSKVHVLKEETEAKDVNRNPNWIEDKPTGNVKKSILPRLKTTNTFDKFSRWLFPLLMGVFIVCYWSYMLNVTEVIIFN